MSIEVDSRFGRSCIWKDETESLVHHCLGAMKRKWPTVMCWGMIGYGWKATLHVWDPETPEKHATAEIEIQKYNTMGMAVCGRLTAR